MTPQEALQKARASTVAFVVAPAADLNRNPDEERKIPAIMGTGFALEQNPRVIVTAAHVSAGTAGKAVELNLMSGAQHIPGVLWENDFEGGESDEIQTTYAVTTGFEISTRHDADVAVIKLPPNSAPVPDGLRLGSAADVHVGDRVVTCGWPYGGNIHTNNLVSPSFAWGTISTIMPHPRTSANRRKEYWIQMPVNPGNSGGAVFKPETGEVVGIISSLLEVRGVRAGLAQAVPIELALPGVSGYLQQGG